MPITKRWSIFNRSNILRIPNSVVGMYELGDKNGEIIYRGKGDGNGGVKVRLLNHLATRRFPSVKYFRYLAAGIFDSGEDMEARHTARTGKPKLMQRAPRERGFFGLL